MGKGLIRRDDNKCQRRKKKKQAFDPDVDTGDQEDLYPGIGGDQGM